MKRKTPRTPRIPVLPAFTAALMAAGLLTEAHAQVQSAGTLFVNVDATSLAEGTLPNIPNTGTLGGAFVAAGGEANTPRVATIGGTKGIQFDGDDFLQLMSAASGGSPILAPFELTGENPTRSIEVWALNPALAGEETLVSWGHRGGAPDGSNMSFNYGSDFRWGAVGHWGNRDIGWNNQGGGPAANQWHHLVYTYDGTTTRVYSDGQLANGEFLGEGAILTHPDTSILIGAQTEADAVTVTPGLRFSGSIGRVRIHDGVLTPEQVAANYSAEKAAFINPPPPEPEPPLVAAPITRPPTHRYSFTHPAGDAIGREFLDSVGTAHGTVQGFSGATFTGSRLALAGGSGAEAAYGDLPNGLLSQNSTNNGGTGGFSFETWFKITGSQNWSRIFDFGSSGTPDFTEEVLGPGGGGEGRDYLMYSAQNGGDTSTRRLEVRNEDPAGGGIVTVDNRTTSFNQDNHVIVTWDEATGRLTAYENGRQVSTVVTDDAMSDINDVNVWLGRSNWTADNNLQGEYDEVRIYDYALSASQALGNAFSGPDLLSSTPTPVTFAVQPQNVSAAETGNATFSFTPQGSPPISMQWFRDGNPIPGAVNPTYTLANATAADNGAVFTARLTNTVDGTVRTVTSQPATLTVTAPTVELKHRYSFNETSGVQVSDSVGNAHGTVVGVAEFAGGELALDGFGTFVDLPNGIVSGLGQDGTIEVWFTQRDNAIWTRIFDFGVSTLGEDQQENGADFLFFTPRTGDGFPRFIANFPGGGDLVSLDPAPPGWVPGNDETHVAISWSASGNTARLYLDGKLVATGTAPRPLSDLAGQDVNNWLGRSQFVADAYWGGKYNEVRLHSGAMTPSQVAASFAAGPGSLPVAAPELGVSRNGNNIVITWPTAAGFVLESSPALGTGATWTAVAGVTGNTATVAAEGQQRFFRLRRP